MAVLHGRLAGDLLSQLPLLPFNDCMRVLGSRSNALMEAYGIQISVLNYVSTRNNGLTSFVKHCAL
jgi:hypothetical protein